MARPTARERFEAKIDFNGPVNPKTGTRCHVWTGARELPNPIDGRRNALPGEDGYGRFWLDGKMWRAHILAWTWAGLPIPPGWEIDHDDEDIGCHNKSCVNVGHLIATTTNGRRRDDNTSGEPGIFWNSTREWWEVRVRGSLNGIYKLHSPAAIGLPSTYPGTQAGGPPQAAIDARNALYLALGQAPAPSTQTWSGRPPDGHPCYLPPATMKDAS